MLTHKINKLSLFVLLGLTALLIYMLFTYLNPVRAIRLHGLDTTNLPAPWPRIFASPQAMPLWLFVEINGKQLQYYAHAPKRHIHRANIVISSIKEILESKIHSVPNGYYLFNLGDITRDDYPYPTLAFTAKRNAVANNKVVLIPDDRALKGHATRFAGLDAVMPQYPWEARKNIIFWRGTATGGKIKDTELTQVPRLRFMRAVKNLQFVDARITNYPASLNKKLILAAEREFPKANYVPLETALGYKYLIDIDGHSCSFDRMAWILYSESVLFKHRSEQTQWYYAKLQPWVHYVPINEDFSNLEQMYYWIEAHPEIAKTMKYNSKQLAQTTFNHAAVLRSLAVGMKEYQKLLRNVQ